MPSEQPKDGGPAFPLPVEADIDCAGRAKSGYGGMTLRDYFAAAALTGILASTSAEDDITFGGVIKLAGHYADAMLRERNK